MYDAQKALLRRHGEHFQQMASYVRECSEDELGELEAAVALVTTTNISWDCYKAAKFLEEEIASLRMQQKRAATMPRPNQQFGSEGK